MRRTYTFAIYDYLKWKKRQQKERKRMEGKKEKKTHTHTHKNLIVVCVNSLTCLSMFAFFNSSKSIAHVNRFVTFIYMQDM